MDAIGGGQNPLSSGWRPQRGSPPFATLTVSIPEAATLLGISKNLAYEAAARGEIPTVKIGRRVLVPRAGLYRLHPLPASASYPHPVPPCRRIQRGASGRK